MPTSAIMRDDRRAAPRTRLDLLFNRYIDGYPHLCRIVDVSETGLLLARIAGPVIEREFYPVEIGVLEDDDVERPERLWLWTKQVWTSGEHQALRFLEVKDRDRAALRGLVARVLETKTSDTVSLESTAQLPC
jgi:hypothetical protein